MAKFVYLLIASLLVFLVPKKSFAAPAVLYFPASYDASSGAPANASRQAEFAPICDNGDDMYSVRLEGLDNVRGFAQAATCPINSVQGTFATQAEYVFLVDDTSELSDYMKTQMRQKNALQSINGREVIRPTLINFESSNERQGFKIFVVGETAYNGVADQSVWLALLNQRQTQGAVVAGGQAGGDPDSDIWVAYHGSFYNQSMELLEDLPLEKIAQYFQQKWQDITEQFDYGATPNSSPAAPPTPTTPPSVPQRQMTDYMRLCSEQGVPLPPTWNPITGTSLWQRQGVQSTLFISATFTTEVWKYQSTTPTGICIALPRMKNGTDINQNIELLGMICQGESSGNACFWDNVARPTPEVGGGQPETTAAEMLVRRSPNRARVKGAATRGLDPFAMSDGYNLSENCTNCHRGDNVYLIHPDTTIDAGDTDHNGSRYQPISGTPASRAWQNPQMTLTSAQTQSLNGCSNSGCHQLPALSFEFCGLLQSAIGNTMPYGDPGDWQTSHGTEIRFLANRCCNLGQRNANTGAMNYINLKQYANAGACVTP